MDSQVWLFVLHCSFAYMTGTEQFNLLSDSCTRLYFTRLGSDQLINDVELQIHHTTQIVLHGHSSQPSDNNSVLFLYEEAAETKNTTNILNVTYSQMRNNSAWLINVTGMEPGHVTLVVNPAAQRDANCSNLSDAFIRFQVYHLQPLNVLSDVIGWIYFAAWSFSFYPQVVLNWRRKSVVGLNFDFIGLNLAGFLCYSIYNIGLFWIPEIRAEFQAQNPHDVFPVELNDVIFALHAVALTAVSIIQIFVYERGSQKVSRIAMGLLAAAGLAALILVVVAAVPSVPSFNWLSMIYGLSYIKLSITLIKYIPQAWMNFRRKSTVGWSIGNVLLDFTGGSCSIIQMFVIAYNFNDWQSIFLNPVKFWLGLLSMVFDVLFIVQHYCLYRNASPYEPVNANT